MELQSATPSSLGNDPPPADSGCPRDQSCSPSPCLNNGLCSPAWDDYTCECTDDYYGQNCTEGKHLVLNVLNDSTKCDSLSVTASTFDGQTSYIEIRLDTNVIPFGDYGSFEFRTRQGQGRLMLLQLLTGVQQTAGGSIEFLIFASQVQVISRFATGQ